MNRNIIFNFFSTEGSAGGILGAILYIFCPIPNKTGNKKNYEYIVFGFVFGSILHYSVLYQVGRLSMLYCFMLVYFGPWVFSTFDEFRKAIVNSLELNKVKIFLASPNDLSEERNSISLMIDQERQLFLEHKKNVELIRWEYGTKSFSETRFQDPINTKVTKSNIFIAMFHRYIGKFTEEEFELAYQNFKSKGKPEHILLYFKHIEKEPEEISEFRDRIINDEQYYKIFNNTEHLLSHLKSQLYKIILTKDRK